MLDKGLKPQMDKGGLKPQNDMPQQCLMQNPYWICKHDRNLELVRMKILLCKCPCGCKCKCDVNVCSWNV